MASVINTNNASLVAQRNLDSRQTELTNSVQRLSSGLRINSAKDDAAGLGISQKLQSQISGANVSARNANDAISMVQTAEGGMQEMSNMLQRMRELATQGNNDSLNDTQRGYIATEIIALRDEINSVSSRTTFNGRSLLDGSIANGGNTINPLFSSLAVGNALGFGDVLLGMDVGGALPDDYRFTVTANPNPALPSMVTLSNGIGPGVGLRNQTIDVTGMTNGVVELDFSQLGVRLTIATSNTLSLANQLNGNSLRVDAGITSAGLKFQVGSGSGDTVDIANLFQSIRVDSNATGNLQALNTAINGIDLSLGAANIPTSVKMGALNDAVDNAIETIAGYRSDFGAMSNRLDYSIANLQKQAEYLTASMSRIMDTDYAAETATLSKSQVMQQAATAMLAQANQMPNAVLALLQ